jgi:hypothetical protein
LLIKTKIDSCHTADSKPVTQEVNGTVILPPFVFPGTIIRQTYLEVQTVGMVPGIAEELVVLVDRLANVLLVLQVLVQVVGNGLGQIYKTFLFVIYGFL